MCVTMYHVIQDVNNDLFRGEAEICIDADLVGIPAVSVTGHFTVHLYRYWASVLLCQ